MSLCPNKICIRRTKTPGTEKIDLIPVRDLAFIKKLVVEINEPTSIRFLAFHVKDKTYCDALKIEDADKRFCSVIKSKYVHFQIEKEGLPPERALFLLAFLPRIQPESELEQVVKELCDIIEWLGIKQRVNCIVFRYGAPVHRKDNSRHWQKSLEKTIEETRKLYTVGQIKARIEHIPENIQKNKTRQLTIHAASPFESIDVS